MQSSCYIENIHEITIDTFEVQNMMHQSLSTPQTFTNWNKETEDDLKSVPEILMNVTKYYDLSRFIYTKKFDLHGNGKVKLPPKIKTLQIIENEHNSWTIGQQKKDLEIENVEEIIVENLMILKCGNEVDVSHFNVEKQIEIRDSSIYGYQNIQVKLPPIVESLKLPVSAIISNQDEVTIREIIRENQQRNNNGGMNCIWVSFV